ncbi:hypothetical protein C8J57DRAFT_1533815 [Mycena rebaudengoi]|nr:hypothetical protein C8J57DRAFT_1533815 [Mycena rebaudengoi]
MLSPATTFVSRNPLKQVQEAHGCKKGPLTDSQKAMRAAGALKWKIAKEALDNDLDKFYVLRNKSILDMAAAHDREPEHIKRLIMSESQFKTMRPKTLRGTLMHDVAVKAKAGMDKLSLPELHALTDMALTEMCTTEEEMCLMAVVKAHCALHHIGLHLSNAAAAADTRYVSTFLQEEMAALFERTGTWGFMFMTHGHLDDAGVPTWANSGDSIHFCVEVLKMQPLDIQGLSTRPLALYVPRSPRSSLSASTRNTATMSYVNFEVDIKEAWKVDISGWPSDINFKRPWAIKGIECLRTLHDVHTLSIP